MKKVLSSILALVILLSLFAGCGQNAAQPMQQSQAPQAEKSEKKQLVFWVPFGGGDYDFMKKIVDSYNESNPKYSVELLSKDWDTYYQGVNSALIANNGPDILVAHQSKLAELIPTGKLKDITSIKSDINWKEYNESQLAGVITDGVQYAVPLDTHALVMFYNEDILARANVTEDDLRSVKNLESWNAILEKISKVIKDNEHVLDIANSGPNTIIQFWTWYLLNAQADGKYLVGNEAQLNSQAGVKALDILVDWNKKGYLKNGIEDGASYDIFKSGAAAINFTGVWATGNYETKKELNFGVMPIPTINGVQKTWGDSHTMTIPSYVSEERQIAALHFADWVCDHGIIWAQAGHVPSKKSVTESEEFKKLPYRSDYAEVINMVEYYPHNEHLGATIDLASLKVSECFNGEYDSQKALDLAKKEIDSLLSK
ncbi:extracellular solute-binding protein [Oscillospiraceae bacterium PP1C4]